MTEIKRYIKLYWEFVKNCTARELEFRMNFFIRTIVYVGWASLTYIGIFLIYGQVNQIGSWDRNEMLLLVTVFCIASSLFKMVFGQNFYLISNYIRKGELDPILLRPINTKFLLLTRFFKFDQIPRLIVFLLLCFKLAAEINSNISVANYIVGFIIMIVGIMGILYFTLAVFCFVFWKPRAWNIWEITNTVRDLAEKPIDVYPKSIIAVFYIIPLAAYAMIPTLILMGQATLLQVVLAVGSPIFFYLISKFVWKEGLKQYESASS